jgi:hypothetical protein
VGDTRESSGNTSKFFTGKPRWAEKLLGNWNEERQYPTTCEFPDFPDDLMLRGVIYPHKRGLRRTISQDGSLRKNRCDIKRPLTIDVGERGAKNHPGERAEPAMVGKTVKH